MSVDYTDFALNLSILEGDVDAKGAYNSSCDTVIACMHDIICTCSMSHKTP